MKKILLLLFEGFEEVEALSPVDILRRAGACVDTRAVGNEKLCIGRSKIGVLADATLDFSADFSDYDMLVIPGGPGVLKLAEDSRVLELARGFSTRKKILGAICAAPLVLFNAGLLEGKRRTAHTSVMDKIGNCEENSVVIDGNVVTSRGAGTAVDFALALVEIILGQDKAKDIAKSICFEK